MLKSQTDMCQRKVNRPVRVAEKETVLDPIRMSFFSTLEGSVHQRVLRACAGRVL